MLGISFSSNKNPPATKLARVVLIIWACVNIGILCGAITVMGRTQYIDFDPFQYELSGEQDHVYYPWLSSIAMKAYMLFVVKTPFCRWLSRVLLVAIFIPILHAKISKVKLRGNLVLWLPLLMFIQYLNLMSLVFVICHATVPF